MANSVVKVTETPVNDSLILVVGEDGTVTPDKETVEAYLNSRPGETDIQIMHVNKSDGKTLDVTVDTLTYIATHEEATYNKAPDMDEISRNLNSFRMDHDYTPLTSPRRQSPIKEVAEVDELAHTLSLLEGSNEEHTITLPPTIRVVKTVPKQAPKRMLHIQPQHKNKVKQVETMFRSPHKTPMKARPMKMRTEEVDDDDDMDDEDFTIESDDADDSDFEMEDVTKGKVKKVRVRTRAPSESDKLKTVKTLKPMLPKTSTPVKPEEPPKVEKPSETSENKAADKKPPKKEKKTPKPIPDDFALFSTPDIIKRVGGKQENVTTPTSPEFKAVKPAKIFPESPKMLQRSSSVESKEKRLSTDKPFENPKPVHRLSLGQEQKNKEKERRHSVDVKGHRLSTEKPDLKKIQTSMANQSLNKSENQVTVQSMEESGSNSNESGADSQLEPMPSAEDIRAIIQNQDTKTFTTGLVIPDPPPEPNVDQTAMNLESAALDLDQSILDNINSDLISEDILYQVAQSLVDNPELQHAIDKSLVDGNLVLDSCLQQNQHAQAQEHSVLEQVQTATNNQESVEHSPGAKAGTQVVRPGGRVVVIPPIERPTTRSRNKRQEPEIKVNKVINRVVDDEHVSGAELDSSSDDDKSDDDPDKLWCICNQPHNNRFMICCDTCEEWYHGKCVNVTKAMGQMMEQEGKEWICLYCKDTSLKRPAAAARRVRKASRASSTDTVERKSESQTAQEVSSPTSVPGCLVCGKPCRTNSIYCSDPCILKHAKVVEKVDLKNAQVVEKVVVFDRSSGKLFSGNNAPSTANLDKWLQQNPGFEVVRSANANKPLTTKALTQSKLKIVKSPGPQGGVSLAVHRKGVNVGILRHSPKPQQTIPKVINKQNITGFKIISKQISTTPRAKLIQPAPLVRTPPTPTPKPKVVQATLKSSPQLPKDKPMPQKTPKSRQAEETAPQPKKEENIRENVQKTLFEQLTNRLKLVDDIKVTKEEINKISTEIELQLYKCFGDTGQKYRNKYRSLIFNIKDIKNQTLWRRICEKSISPYQVVRLSPDDMASQELALWRERENKHQLEMITKTELEQLGRNRQYVFKTHKGEQELEENRPTDAVDNTEVIMGLGADSSGSLESSSDKREGKEKEKKGGKHSKVRDRHDRKSSKEKDREGRKERKKDRRSVSRDRGRRKRSRSKERDSSRHREKNRSRSRDRDRHRRSHKSSRHKKDIVSTTEKLDKKSKEILEQLVDNKIVPPLEDRLWKHVQQEDMTTAPAESDSDHEPTSTVTIPTPPRLTDMDESQSTSTPVSNEAKDKQDEEADYIIKDESTPMEIGDDDVSQSPPPKTHAEFIWKGTINMVDVAQISITAHEVSGDCTGLGDELPPCLDVVGRISPETVWDYIGKMKCSNSKTISLLRLNATNVEEKMPYIALYSYLSSRNRLGVVKSTNKAVKDFYILPLANQKPIPQALLPINGPGFEESRPALLLGIIVRDKRKRPLFVATPSSTSSTASKRTKLDVPALPVTPSSTRSYTPPPSTADPRLKTSSKKDDLKDEEDDMDEPYSPEDSDPESLPSNLESKSGLNSSDLSNILTGSVKSSSFLDSGLTSQTFQPFSSKFDTIPGLDESGAILANSEELKRKMDELDQRIAMQKAEIDNMSQDIASSATTDLGTSALASIALPSNLQQILDSIKGISANTPGEKEASQVNNESKSSGTPPDTDLTIPLILPKIGTRSHTTSSASTTSTIPLNLPKYKSKFSLGNSPDSKSATAKTESDKNTSVLSSLSEEDLIKKAAEMLGETDTKSEPAKVPVKPITPAFNVPNIVPTAPFIPPTGATSKNADVNQPPIPGLEEDELLQ